VPLQKKLHQQLMLWLPIGLFTSLLASFLLLRLLRRLRSPRNGMLDALNSMRFRFITSPLFRCRVENRRRGGAGSLEQPDGSFYRRIFLFRLPNKPG
jgi:sensor c-di-GMP phosphodiesterase-like protein